MSTTLTNSNLTQIAVKRLSGKAMTNSNSAIPAEKFGSTIQSSATTIFGQSVPNNPSTASADLYRIQSASDGGPGTVQLVTFDVVAIGSEYANTNDGNLYSDEVAVGADTGDSYGVTTYHAYALKLTGSYEEDVTAFGGSDYFANNASTSKVLGTDPEFSNNFISTGSTQFQIVPEYLSTIVGSSNPYIPIVSNTSGDDFYDPAGFISPTDGIDYYLDTFAGILFIQDPVQYGTPDANGASQNSGATIPKRVRAFLYTGKYQSEIAGGDSVSLHFSASSGGGFSITNETTASFITGSTSGGGLSIQANVGNALSFTLNNVISGSEQILNEIEGPTTINITASYAEEAVEVGITEKSLAILHPIVFTKDNLAATPSNGGISFEELAISNKSSAGDDSGLYFVGGASGESYIVIRSGSDSINSNNGQLLIGTKKFEANGAYSLLNTDATDINFGGSANTIDIGGSSGTGGNITITNTAFTSSIEINLINEDTGSIHIRFLSESTERTPLVIDSNGKVTKANADFATDIVISGSIGINIVSQSALSAGTNQGEYDLTVNGVVVSDDISSGLTTADSPQFVGIEATNAAFDLATVQENGGNQTITIGNASNSGNQITLNGTASITGDLIVQGVTTTLNTTNLLVEDKFILLNSGSTGIPGSEGGIIVQTQPNAAGGKGTSMYYDSTLNRWLITSASSIEPDASSINGNLAVAGKKAAIVTVQVDGGIPSTTPLFGSTDDYRLGQMYVDTDNTDGDSNNIWVYA